MPPWLLPQWLLTRWLLLAYALTNAVLYSMLLPLWEGFDEPFHFGYVQALANGQGFPDPRTSLLTQEVGASLLLAPGSLSVQRNLPGITSYHQFFEWPESQRRDSRRQLVLIDPALRWQPGNFLNYEALQAPIAYAALALPERALARVPLLPRVLLLRILAGAAGALLLLLAAERLAAQLNIPDPYSGVLAFCALSTQMLWATLAHIANDWLAVPLSVWLLVAVIHYQESPAIRRAAMASALLATGLLTKAYFMAFVLLLVVVCIFRRRWRDLILALAILLATAGPWYLRNVQRYGTVSGMQEVRQGIDPSQAVPAIRIAQLPAALEAWTRTSLWNANNSFRSFSINTLRLTIAAWLAALLLWAITRHRTAEWIVLAHSSLFLAALGYKAAVDYVASHGEVAIPGGWFAQVLLVPMLALAMLGASRSRKAGTAVAAAMVLLFGYILIATYWVKLIPLYGGFGGRTSLVPVAMLYRDGLPTLQSRLNDVCLAPATAILFLSSLVSILAVGQQVILIRHLWQKSHS